MTRIVAFIIATLIALAILGPAAPEPDQQEETGE